MPTLSRVGSSKCSEARENSRTAEPDSRRRLSFRHAFACEEPGIRSILRVLTPRPTRESLSSPGARAAVCGVAALFFLAAARGLGAPERMSSWLFQQISFLGFMGMSALALALLQRPQRLVVSFGLTPSRLGVWEGALIVVGILLFGVGLSRIVGLDGGPVVPNAEFSRALFAATPFVWLLIVGLLPVLLEEMLFRGALLRWMRSRVGWRLAVLFSSIAFAAFHIGTGGKLFAFSMALPLAWLAIRADSIRETLLIHVLYNGFALLPGMD